MTDILRDGARNDPLRAYKENHLIAPTFKLPEALVDDLTAWARAYRITPGELARDILQKGLRDVMFPSDAGVISGPKGPISVQKLGRANPQRGILEDYPV